MPAAPLNPDLLAPVLEAPGAVLPAAAYRDPDVYAWEQAVLFAGSWVCVGRAADLSEPGDQVAVRVGGEGVLLVRDTGAVRAFANTCRHRGHELLGDDEKVCRRVVRCPYHGWMYELDGGLRTAPSYGPELARDRLGLVPLAVEDWRGWRFVNVDGQAPPLRAQLAGLDELVAGHEPERLVSAATTGYEVAANWKVLVENYHECYHCPSIHPELCRVTPPRSGTTYPSSGAWAGGSMDLRPHAATMSLDGNGAAGPLRGLTEPQRREVRYLELFPTLLISLHPDYVLTHRLQPLAPDRTRVVCDWLFAPEAVAADGFDPAYAVEFWDLTNRQDWRACESVQRGVAGRFWRPGPLSPEEASLHRFLTMVATAYLTGSPRPAV